MKRSAPVLFGLTIGVVFALAVYAVYSLMAKRGGLVLSNEWADSDVWRGQP